MGILGIRIILHSLWFVIFSWLDNVALKKYLPSFLLCGMSISSDLYNLYSITLSSFLFPFLISAAPNASSSLETNLFDSLALVPVGPVTSSADSECHVQTNSAVGSYTQTQVILKH